MAKVFSIQHPEWSPEALAKLNDARKRVLSDTKRSDIAEDAASEDDTEVRAALQKRLMLDETARAEVAELMDEHTLAGPVASLQSAEMTADDIADPPRKVHFVEGHLVYFAPQRRWVIPATVRTTYGLQDSSKLETETGMTPAFEGANSGHMAWCRLYHTHHDGVRELVKEQADLTPTSVTLQAGASVGEMKVNNG